MGLFSRNRKGNIPPSEVRSAEELQIPDQLALEARELYGNQKFAAAFETYAKTIDKIHTMCVVAPPHSRIRQPGPGDQSILEGLVSAAGAALAMDPDLDLKPVGAGTIAYLIQVADECGSECPVNEDGSRYRTAALELERVIGL